MPKRTDETLRFIISGADEIRHSIHVKARTEHRLTLPECEQLRTLETAHRNACVNLNQNKMRTWGKKG